MLAVSFSKGSTIFQDDRGQKYSFHCMQDQKRELHVFLKKFYLPSLSAGVILSVVESVYCEGGKQLGRRCVSYRFNGCLQERAK